MFGWSKFNYETGMWWVGPGCQPSSHPATLSPLLPAGWREKVGRTGARKLMGQDKGREITVKFVLSVTINLGNLIFYQFIHIYVNKLLIQVLGN